MNNKTVASLLVANENETLFCLAASLGLCIRMVIHSQSSFSMQMSWIAEEEEEEEGRSEISSLWI